MCDFKETTRRLLTIPPDFVPYMEKHKLYEFFYVIKLEHLLLTLSAKIFSLIFIAFYYNIKYINLLNIYIYYCLLYYIQDIFFPLFLSVTLLYILLLYYIKKYLQELVTQLLIQQPEDPIVFMKQCIQHAIRKRDIARIILIAPPSFGIICIIKC